MGIMLSNNKKSDKTNEMVLVAVRCRPMSEKEVSNNYSSVVRVDSLRNTVQIRNLRQGKLENPKTYKFDAVFDEKSSQSEVYDKMIQPLVDSVLSGYNSTVFAYGQSGSGKTYTMEGLASEHCKGVLPRTFKHIYEHISNSCNIQYLVQISYMEIYQDEIRDLLYTRRKGKKYEIRETKDSGVYVKHVSTFVCKSEEEINRMIEAGRRNRISASTDMNERSSRSHAIVTITVEMKDLIGSSDGRVRVGKLNLVDLAGSERQNKTNAEGERLKEANKINLSLSALGNVICALSENKNHIPYRDSKLTRILKDSLGGNSKTLMIANISPASYNYEESLNTLRYATRAKNIRNVPHINEDPVDTLIRRYQEEIKQLKCQLQERTTVIKNCHVLKPTNDEDLTNISKQEFRPNGCSSSNERGMIEDNEEKSSDSDTYAQMDDVFDLKKRIEVLESRLLIGNKTIVEHTAEQKKALEKHLFEIDQIKQREKEMSEFLEKEKGAAEEIKDEFYSLEQEVDMKKKKLTKACLKLQAIDQEIKDAKDEFNTDRRELEITQEEILKEIKLKLLIMENFIPKEHRRHLLSRMQYDEDLDCWQMLKSDNCDLGPTLPKPKSVESTRRPMTLFSAKSKRKDFKINKDITHNNLRFKGENILELNLIHSPHLTKRYEPPKLPSALKSVFQAALQLEEDLDIDVTRSSLSGRASVNSPRRSLDSILKNVCEKNPRKTQSAVNLPVYPKARGLVRK